MRLKTTTSSVARVDVSLRLPANLVRKLKVSSCEELTDALDASLSSVARRPGLA
jgi:hypothetical protein